MPKACHCAFCSFCARAVLDRVGPVRALMGPTVRARDVEAVHDMRVASRRLRAAMALFEPCLPAPTRAWRKEVRRITRALGQARDCDVQSEALQSAMAKHRAWGADLAGLVADLAGRRRAAQRKVVKALARAGESGVYEQIEAALAPIAQAMPGKGPAWKDAYRRAEKMLVALLADLKKYEGALARPSAVGQHHRMRIAAKHLRYSLEAFEAMYGRGIRPAILAAKRMQSLLGDMHDCDVWERLLSGAATGLPGQADKATEGLRAFARDRRRRRQRLYRQARQYWQKCRKDRVWVTLRQTLARAAAASR